MNRSTKLGKKTARVTSKGKTTRGKRVVRKTAGKRTGKLIAKPRQKRGIGVAASL